MKIGGPLEVRDPPDASKVENTGAYVPVTCTLIRHLRTCSKGFAGGWNLTCC